MHWFALCPPILWIQERIGDASSRSAFYLLLGLSDDFQAHVWNIKLDVPTIYILIYHNHGQIDANLISTNTDALF